VVVVVVVVVVEEEEEEEEEEEDAVDEDEDEDEDEADEAEEEGEGDEAVHEEAYDMYAAVGEAGASRKRAAKQTAPAAGAKTKQMFAPAPRKAQCRPWRPHSNSKEVLAAGAHTHSLLRSA